ncbi:hypothetical protein [Allobranchiibius huperziae]|uniref:Uncharacterized protein n=1 Tax=Allobranchiibius huperziae TaxID=1874116 RepID=A0A853DG81_9MICO|nr:hypothetical protein [Allobranchiibius huperziae]NYJ76552.1 hypothetical protein [Allobranchiibius huperziae]
MPRQQISCWRNVIGAAQLMLTVWLVPSHLPTLAAVAVELAVAGWALWFTSHWRFARRSRWWLSPVAGRVYWRVRHHRAAPSAV